MKKLYAILAAALMSFSAMAATGLNVYTSGLKSTQAEDSLTIEYSLNTAATNLYVVFYDADGALYDAVNLTDATLYTEGAHTVKIALPEDMEGGTYTWGMTAHGAPTTFADVCDNTAEHYSFYLMQDVVVDNSPESPYFGQVYVNMPWAGESDGGTATTKAQPAGIYVYNPQLELANYQAGYTGGLTLPAGNRQSIKRLTVGEDGMVYIGGNKADFTPGVWKMNPADFTAAWTQVLDPATASPVAGLEVVGNKLYTINNVSLETGDFVTYDLTATPYASQLSTEITMDKNIANADLSIRSDRRGGFWVVQHRYSMDAYSPLQHWSFNSKGKVVVDYAINSSSDDAVKALLNNALNSHNISYRGALGVSPDGSLIAMGNDKTVKVFQVTYDANGVPSLTEYCRTGTIAGNIDGVAFDYANNLYFASASSERFYVYPMAKGEGENHCTVPAPKQYTVTVEAPEPEEQHLYIIGDIQGWKPAEGIEMTAVEGQEGVFTYNYVYANNGFFAFITVLGADNNDWTTVNAHRFGPETKDAVAVIGENTLVAQDAAFQLPAGDYTFTVDVNALKLTVVSNTSALEDVEATAASKFIENGQLFILRNGVRYNALGTVVE